jgi:UDP-glucose 4-epimerase
MIENIPTNILTPLRLQETGRLVELLDGVEAVIHFAAYIAVGESTREPDLFFQQYWRCFGSSIGRGE